MASFYQLEAVTLHAQPGASSVYYSLGIELRGLTITTELNCAERDQNGEAHVLSEMFSFTWKRKSAIAQTKSDQTAGNRVR